MIDLYLKALTEQALITALPFARKDNKWMEADHDYAIDIIGDLYNDDAIYSGENVITPATKIVGFHANLRCTQALANLVPLNVIVTPPPTTLVRVWV